MPASTLDYHADAPADNLRPSHFLLWAFGAVCRTIVDGRYFRPCGTPLRVLTESKSFEMVLRALVPVTFLLCQFCITAAGAAERDETGWVQDNHGARRKFLLHVPAKANTRALPLVVVLHGGGQNCRRVRYVTAMNALADQEKFAVVYPDGSGRFKRFFLTWNAGDCCGYSRSRKVNDVVFIDALVEKILARGGFDRNRVYLAGYSNGAMMAYKAASENATRFAAIASVGGSMTGRERLPADPLSVLIIHGTADNHVPYTGGAGKLAKWGYPVNRQSVEYAKSFWIKANECNVKTVDQQYGALRVERFCNVAHGTEVQLCTMYGGWHMWPGGKSLTGLSRKRFPELEASRECWNFFSRHARESSQPRLVQGAADHVAGGVKDQKEQRGG